MLLPYRHSVQNEPVGVVLVLECRFVSLKDTVVDCEQHVGCWQIRRVEIGDLPGWQMSASSLRHSKVKGTLHGSGLTGSSVFSPQRFGPVIPAIAYRSRKRGTLLR